VGGCLSSVPAHDSPLSAEREQRCRKAWPFVHYSLLQCAIDHHIFLQFPTSRIVENRNGFGPLETTALAQRIQKRTEPL
jgi:hypothetical protein